MQAFNKQQSVLVVYGLDYLVNTALLLSDRQPSGHLVKVRLVHGYTPRSIIPCLPSNGPSGGLPEGMDGIESNFWD